MTHRSWLFNTAIFAGLWAIVGAAPVEALAQTAPKANDSPSGDAAKVDELIVTGSRIKRSDFTSAAPIQVITTEQSILEGLVDPAQILQGTPVASGSTQINNQFTGFVVNGGGGINTISLRGLGDNRTLVLMNGRRLPPAGTSGSVAAVDLNTLPSTAIDRYEILKDGASSVYGSDAIAGVVNVITRKNLDGWIFQAASDAPTGGGGQGYNLGAGFGKVFDKGHLMVNAEYYQQRSMRAGDRSEFMCQQAYVRDPVTGQRKDWIDVDTGLSKCYGPSESLWGYIPVYRFTGAFKGSRASIATEGAAFAANPANGWVASLPDAEIPGYRFAQLQERNSVHPLEERIDVFSPAKRATAFADFDYDLGFGKAYGELLISNRQSSQFAVQQMFPIIAPEAPCSVNVFNCAGVSAVGLNKFAPQALILSPFTFSQDVTVTRLLSGVKGDLSQKFMGGGWTYDAYLMFSHNRGLYTQVGVSSDALLSAIGGDWAQSDFTGICPTGSPAGCHPINLVSDAYLARGTWSAEDYEYLRLSSTGRTIYDQMTAEAQIAGDLFRLPAGAVSSAWGVTYRKDSINDRPGEATQKSLFYNLATAGVTKGDDRLLETYGEVELPLIRAVKGFELLTLNLTGRYSDYKSYGSNSTYRATFNWKINSQFRVRGTVGTSFRAPALFELNLGDQGGFLSQASVDPCITYDDPAKKISDTIKANCKAAGVPGDYDGFGSSAFLKTGGGKNLKAEESEAKTIGVIWSPSFADLRVSVDYFDILIKNEVTSDGAAVVGRCYSSANFPKDPFCGLLTRDPDSLNITAIDASYRNITSQRSAGYDLNLTASHEFRRGKVELNSQYTWTTTDEVELFAGSKDRFNGVIGEPSVTGDNQVKYLWHDWVFAWTSHFVGSMGNYKYQFDQDTTPSNQATPTGSKVRVKSDAEATWWHDLAAEYRGDNWRVTVGVSNVFGETAPNVSDAITPDRGQYTYGRLGTAAFATQYYDLYRGRTAFMSLQRRY